MLDYIGADNYRPAFYAIVLFGNLLRFKMIEISIRMAENAENSILAKNLYVNALILLCVNIINMTLMIKFDPIKDREYLSNFIAVGIFICFIINRENEQIGRINELVERGRIIYGGNLQFKYSKEVSCDTQDGIWCECPECKKCEF